MNDILLNTGYDASIANGDFVTGFSDQQNQNLLLISEKGAYKESPGVGVGLFSFLENDATANMLSEIRRQFTDDGMTINKLTYLGEGKLNIDASY